MCALAQSTFGRELLGVCACARLAVPMAGPRNDRGGSDDRRWRRSWRSSWSSGDSGWGWGSGASGWAWWAAAAGGSGGDSQSASGNPTAAPAVGSQSASTNLMAAPAMASQSASSRWSPAPAEGTQPQNDAAWANYQNCVKLSKRQEFTNIAQTMRQNTSEGFC